MNICLSLAWHDFGLHHYHVDRPPDKLKWFTDFIDSLILRCINDFQKPFSNLRRNRHQFILRKERCSLVCKTILSHQTVDVQYDHVSAPCGTIQLFRPAMLPIIFKWKIVMHDSYIVNSTFIMVNIIHNDVRCDHNSVKLSEDGGIVNNDIAKLCGRSQGKVFYSRGQSVILIANLSHLNGPIAKLLHYQYQACSILIVKDIRMSHSRERFVLTINSLQALVYNSQVTTTVISLEEWSMHIKLNYQPKSCSWTNKKIYVYDGPNSGSPLLVSIDKQNRNTRKSVKSSLLHLTIVTMNMHGNCFETEYLFERREFKAKILSVTNDELQLPFYFGAQEGNVFEVFTVKVSPHLSINVRLNNYSYTGSTEYNCLHGQIMLADAARRKYGPYCGVFGNKLVEDELLDGITFVNHNVTIIIVIQAQSSVTMSGEFVFSSSKCEGIVNICDRFNVALPSQQTYTGKYYHLRYMWDKGLGKPRFKLTLSEDINACVILQGFHSTMSRTSCIVEITQGKLKVHTNMAYVTSDTSLSKACYKKELEIFIKNNLNVAESMQYEIDDLVRIQGVQYLVVLPPNSHQTHSTYSSNFMQKDIVFQFETSCSAFMNDGYVLKLSRDKCVGNYTIADDSCPSIEPPSSTAETCSNHLIITQYAGLYCVKIQLPKKIIWNSMTDLLIKFHFTNLLKCKQSETFHIVTLQINSFLGLKYLTWNITKPDLEWLLEGRANLASVDIVLLLNGMFQDRQYFTDFKLSTLSQYVTQKPKACDTTHPSVVITIEYQKADHIYIAEDLWGLMYLENKNDFYTDTGHYKLFPRSASTWNSAYNTCIQHQSRLLAINTELEENTLIKIFRNYAMQPFSQLLFLDLQIHDKVSESTSILCLSSFLTYIDKACFTITAGWTAAFMKVIFTVDALRIF